MQLLGIGDKKVGLKNEKFIRIYMSNPDKHI